MKTAPLLLLSSLAATTIAWATPAAAAPQSSASSEQVDALPSALDDARVSSAEEIAAALPRKPRQPGLEGQRVAVRELDRLYYTTQADGSIWVSGQTYKARFGSGGATYVPFLGSHAPRNFPLELSLASAHAGEFEIPLAPAVSALRDGDRVVIDRGPIDEVYELALGSVEQTFVITERPAQGDLRLVVRMESEMSRSEDQDGFTWSNELGSVHYGRAFVREAGGGRVPVASRSVDGGIEIVVGRDALARATFPLVVDPVITTFAIDANGQDTYDADVAYDLTTDRTLTVYEFSFSQVDGDVHALLREGFGISHFAVLDNTTENWRGPQCANLNYADQFLMVAQVSNVVGLPNWNIWGMTVDAISFVPGWKTLISTTEQTGAKYLGDVGGDAREGAGPAYYCVTWRRDKSATDWDIHARFVTAQGTVAGTQTILVDNSIGTRDSFPSISKSNKTFYDESAAWTIAWHRELSTTNYDIWAAQVSWLGFVLNGPTRLTYEAGFEYYPRVSSPLEDGRVLVVHGVDQGPDDDIHYALLNGTTRLSWGSLTYLDSSAYYQPRNQIDYSVDSDGTRFAVAYAESFGSSTFDYDIWISTFAAFGNSLTPIESRAILDDGLQQALRTDVVAQRSGGQTGSPRFHVRWDSTGNGGHDVYGGIFDRNPGGAAGTYCYGFGPSSSCPCADNTGFETGCPNSYNAFGSRLDTLGRPQPGAGDTLTFSGTGMPPNVTCTLFQGTTQMMNSFLGDGMRCVGGAQLRIRTQVASIGGGAMWPLPGDPAIGTAGQIPGGGGFRFYQVIYRNAADFCTPATVNTSNGVWALWLP